MKVNVKKGEIYLCIDDVNEYGEKVTVEHHIEKEEALRLSICMHMAHWISQTKDGNDVTI